MMTGGTFDLFLGIAMIAVFVLTGGGIALLRSGKDRTRAWLMLVAAGVLLFNVLVWTV